MQNKARQQQQSFCVVAVVNNNFAKIAGLGSVRTGVSSADIVSVSRRVALCFGCSQHLENLQVYSSVVDR